MRRRYHLRLPFYAYCALTLLIALAAMNTGANLLFWVFAVSASSLLVSGAVSGVMMVNLRVRHVVPAHGGVGEPLIVHYAASLGGTPADLTWTSRPTRQYRVLSRRSEEHTSELQSR